MAEDELVAGRLDSALRLVDSLLQGASGTRSAPVVLLRAAILTALGDRDNADAALEDARRLAETHGPRTLMWRVAARRSELWRQIDPSVAEREAANARLGIADLARSIDDPDRRATFLNAPEVRAWTGPVGRQRTRSTASPGGLTRRERDVARCVARWMSNRAIARALSVSEKTVEMHVSGCLAKLGQDSRSQLAVWTVAHGLVDSGLDLD
jgi:DNA-binding CsgD family transcriptional regulator